MITNGTKAAVDGVAGSTEKYRLSPGRVTVAGACDRLSGASLMSSIYHRTSRVCCRTERLISIYLACLVMFLKLRCEHAAVNNSLWRR